MSILTELYTLRFLLTSAAVLVYVATKIHAYRRLSAFKGPFSTGWCEVWHSSRIISVDSHLAYQAVNDKYGQSALRTIATAPYCGASNSLELFAMLLGKPSDNKVLCIASDTPVAFHRNQQSVRRLTNSARPHRTSWSKRLDYLVTRVARSHERRSISIYQVVVVQQGNES